MKFERETNLYQDQALARKFKSQDTEFEIIQGHINAMISESEIRELINGGKTMYSAMNDIKIDVNGLSANLSTLSTTVNEDSGKIGTLETNYATYKAEVDKYIADLGTTTQTANDAMSKVASVEATASGISTAVTAVEKNLRDNYYNKTTTNDKLATVANDASTALQSAVQAMQAQVDGKIETWANYGVPTASNKPASDWTTADLKNAHVGDIYYDTNTGKVYEYQKSGNNYLWNPTQTASGIQNALTAAQDANTLAGTKKQIFTSQPTTANDYYNVGDLWVNATYDTIYSNDLLRCKTAKAKGDEFSIDHWEKASKYTDDSKATEVANNLRDNYYTIAETNSMFTQTSEAITSTVSAKYTADNLIQSSELTTELGGTRKVSFNDNQIDFVTVDSKLCTRFKPNNNSTSTPYLIFLISDTMREKTRNIGVTITDPITITISAEIKITTPKTNNVYFTVPEYTTLDKIKKSHDGITISKRFYTTNTYDTAIDVSELSGSGWQKVWVSLELKGNRTHDNIITCNFNINSATSGFVFLRHVKLEYGEYASAWTPAKEDIKVDFEGNEIVSRINQTATTISIKAQKININGIFSANETFHIDTNGNLTATGGTIGGWTITNGKIYGGDSETGVAVMQKPGGESGTANWVFAAGGTSHSDYGDCKFKVSKNGDLYAVGNGQISGWGFTRTKIFGGDASTGVAVMQIPTATTTWVFAAGGNTHDTYSGCPFRVSKAGILYAKGATIQQASLGTCYINGTLYSNNEYWKDFGGVEYRLQSARIEGYWNKTLLSYIAPVQSPAYQGLVISSKNYVLICGPIRVTKSYTAPDALGTQYKGVTADITINGTVRKFVNGLLVEQI